MKPLDYVTLLFAAALVVAISTAVYGGADGRATVLITAPDAEYLFASSVEETIAVSGPIGQTVVEIADGGARVISSPCDNQICVLTGHVERAGRWIACLPNRVFVSIESGSRTDVDARSY